MIAMTTHALTDAQHGVLFILNQCREPATLADLRKRCFGIGPKAMAQTLIQLQTFGYIERTGRHSEARISITASGRTALAVDAPIAVLPQETTL